MSARRWICGRRRGGGNSVHLVSIVLLLVVVCGTTSVAARDDTTKRDAHCKSVDDWKCIVKEMLQVIEEEFAAVGDKRGTYIPDANLITTLGGYADTPGKTKAQS